ncbi:tryptophan synthase subunit alpha [secondary endosymbiont of Ctenarytaina eucalypti]|uniref:Tryptophan synthase alpha chain n=1 Tax=secondary endosymbiont of Ctenarytaina eucalypti TaxID=1199245 RepID=J3Z4B3_9ENTR|nr:tryptophan synthase subunit alpha [secondary endosymbiont of Ctenarytaina eucalypti]AFP85129.1 tryptophan synthase, alpha chain [secondary endosymbiont of Ctenarytaina eucalypti]
MERYQKLFSRLAARNEGAFVAFVTLGDPNPAYSLKIIDTLIDAGADALELGVPFSDPLADGAIIQNANLRAFASGVTRAHCFEMLASIRLKYPEIPIGLLIYANLVYSNGINAFYARCSGVGVDSVLVADVPLQESLPFRHAALQHGVAPIFICPPNADDALVRKISLYSKGYTYLLARSGVTGSEKRAKTPVVHLINALKEHQAAPTLQGFGISEPNQVRNACRAGVAGAISGSAIVRLIENHVDNLEVMLEKLAHFVREMKIATLP